MRSILLTLLLISLLPYTSKAQKLKFKGDFLLFREAKTKQPVLIINDSLVYKGNDMKRIAFKHTEYPASLNEYLFFNIGNRTYLVHEGCGPVLEYRNDSIVRIDNSFLHRNQFRAVRFVYNNEIYFYGGYGLFTFKNILTKYDFQTREWIEVKTFSDVPVDTRESAFSYMIDNNLYVFGGFTKNEKKVIGGKLLDNTIWRLHLPTMQWYCSGQIRKENHIDISRCRLFSSNLDKMYYISDIYNEIDFKKNIVKKYELKLFSKYLLHYYEGDNIICILFNEINKNNYFAILPSSAIKGKQLSTSILIEPLPLTFNNCFILITMFMGLCIILLIFRKSIINKLKPFDGVIYNQKNQLFLYKNKPITIFDEQEKKLLIYLMEQKDQFVSLNNLNQLFENSNQPETFSATVKRREQTVLRLLTKVSKITGIDEKQLLIEQKNSEDKRIKDLKILPNLLKII